MCGLLPVSRLPFVKPLCVPHLLRSDWMRPRITKAKLRGGFLGDEFVGRFDNRAKWITQLARMFPVGVVNTPELTARLRSHGCAHVWQFTRNRLREDVSATQNTRTVRAVSDKWSRQRRCLSRYFRWRAHDPPTASIFTKGPSDVLDHATSEIASGSKLGIDATKEIPGEGFKRPWPPLIAWMKRAK